MPPGHETLVKLIGKRVKYGQGPGDRHGGATAVQTPMVGQPKQCITNRMGPFLDSNIPQAEIR